MVFISRNLRLQHLLSPAGPRNDVQIQTNSFKMKPPTQRLHHYDVVIEPLWLTQGEFKIGSKKGNKLIMLIQSSNPDVFSPRAAFDGRKNLFAPKYYFPERTFEVDWAEDPGTDKRGRRVKIVIKHVNEMNFGNLHKYIGTQQHSDQYQNEVNLLVNMLNVLANAAPRQKAGIMATARSIFVSTEKRTSDRIAPLELWRGYFQTVRPAFDKMLVNIDVTIGVVLPADKLENVCATYLGCRNLQDLRHLRGNDFQKLRHFLRGVKVTVDIHAHKNKSAKIIKDLVQNVGDTTFDRNGEIVTVAQHFRESHNLQIQPSTLGVKLSSAGNFPITFCRTVEQFYKNRASSDVVRAALEFTPPNPSARAVEIRNAFNHFEYGSGFLTGAGIEIDPTPQEARGRLLAKPTIIFSNGTRDFNGRSARPGVWDVMDQRLVKPAQIPSWIVVEFAGAKRDMLQSFVSELIQAMLKLGIQVSQPATIANRSPQGDIDRILGELTGQYNPKMILAALPDQAEELYRKVKRFGDIQKGVATQCVRWISKMTRDIGTRKINQFHNNLILKINPKMGGTNFYASSRVLDGMRNGGPFMIIGADVSHPGPGSQMPSVASLVASFDREACQYAASMRIQSSRVEVIEEFGDMFRGLLNVFKNRNNGIVPRDIYIFRDGVSEGEFSNVENHEKKALDAVIESVYEKGPPRIVYIVVGKRHHVRFFPPPGPSAVDPRGNGNFYSGLVVDQDIVHPRYCDFYLQSQAGLKGTSIPSHYTILRNDKGMAVADIQDLAYALCHSYSRSTRSVKIPAPVYYADLVCRRAKFHYQDNINDYSVSSVSGDDPDSHLDHYRAHFDAVKLELHDKMYYV